jgi:membrane-bound ClpP family serine protease
VLYARYLLFEWGHLTAPLAWGLLGLWVLKDALMFPVTKVAYETPHRPHGPEALLGEVAVAQGPITSWGAGDSGWVLVRGELWRAHSREGTAAVAQGDRVRVVEARGHVLVVESPA